MKEVEKVWGWEHWIANEPEYCGKLLYISKGASSSLHYHPKKKETFYLLSGEAELELGEDILFHFPYYNYPVTIAPNTLHRFTAAKDSVILEVSTHHNDKDVVRLEESKSGVD